MKKHLLIGMLALAAGSLMAADLKDDVVNAAKKLADKDNYSWKQTTENAGGRGFGGGAMEGKVQKSGCTWVSFTMRDNTIEAVKQGSKGAIKGQDGWQSLAEATGGDPGPASFMARRVETLQTPAAQAQELAGKVKEFKKDGEAYAGDLTEDGAKSLLMFGGRGGGNGPEISGAQGSVKFWVADGVLTKYQTKVKGTMSFNGNERQMDRTTTVEIKDVGTTKLDLPEEAKKKLQ